MSQMLQGQISNDPEGQSDTSLYAPTSQGYGILHNHPVQPYVIAPGTIDLSQRQIVPNDPGHPYVKDPRAYGSEYSARDQLPNGAWMSYPTIYDGEVHPRQEAYSRALSTGQHLNIYAPFTPTEYMDHAENLLHSRKITINGKSLTGDSYAASKRKISDIKKKGGKNAT